MPLLNKSSQITSIKPVIAFDGIGKIYGPQQPAALTDVSFKVQKSEFVCLIGPSGSGKSTVLKLVAGLEQPSSGQLTVPDSVAMVFQGAALLPWLSVFDNVALGLRAKKFKDKKVTELADKYIELMGLGSFKDKLPRDLSGGQRQRVGIARALAVEPEVLLLDEPFSALDVKTTEELHKDVLKIWQETKQTILMVSHLVEEAVALADRILLIKAGRLAESFDIRLPYPRREKEAEFMHHVQTIRRKFFE